jgi:PD-(D/E)XK endonuclease
VEIVRNRTEDVGDARRYGVVIGRIFAAADGEDCGDFRSRDGCSLLRDEEEGNELVIDRLFALADERVYGRRRNRKWVGEMAEAAFLHKAMELGLVASKPWGDNSRYDFVVDAGERLVRVQVKSTSCLCEGRYAVAAHGSDPKAGYSAQDIDFLVAHVPPEEAWYVIPVEAFAPHLHLWLYPQGEHAGQYEKYREAWELLGAGVGVRS